MFEYHHIGILVDNIEESIEYYKIIFKFAEVSKIYNISNQKVKVCFIKNGIQSYIELVEPDQENTILRKLLDKKTSYYHIGYLVDNMDMTLEQLKENTYIVNRFNSEAFDNKECAFVYTKEMHLIELINR